MSRLLFQLNPSLLFAFGTSRAFRASSTLPLNSLHRFGRHYLFGYSIRLLLVRIVRLADSEFCLNCPSAEQLLDRQIPRRLWNSRGSKSILRTGESGLA